MLLMLKVAIFIGGSGAKPSAGTANKYNGKRKADHTRGARLVERTPHHLTQDGGRQTTITRADPLERHRRYRMSAPLVVSIPHTLGRAEALRRLKSGLEGMPQAGLLTLEQQGWTDNRMSFMVRALGQSVPGSLEVLDDSVRLEVVLPGLLLKLWEPLKTVLLGRAKLLLEKK